MKHLNLIALAILGIALLSSCTDDTADTQKYNTVFYKVRNVEDNTKLVVLSAEPKDITGFEYTPGDTVWINLETKRIDFRDSLAMKAVILENKGIKIKFN